MGVPGDINKGTRRPVLGARRMAARLSAGSFGTVVAAAGANLPLGRTVAMRADASYQRSDSLYDVEDNATFAAGATARLLLAPSDTLPLPLAIDHFEDRHDATYPGLPPIPAAFPPQPGRIARTPNRPRPARGPAPGGSPGE